MGKKQDKLTERHISMLFVRLKQNRKHVCVSSFRSVILSFRFFAAYQRFWLKTDKIEKTLIKKLAYTRVSSACLQPIFFHPTNHPLTSPEYFPLFCVFFSLYKCKNVKLTHIHREHSKHVQCTSYTNMFAIAVGLDDNLFPNWPSPSKAVCAWQMREFTQYVAVLSVCVEQPRLFWTTSGLTNSKFKPVL